MRAAIFFATLTIAPSAFAERRHRRRALLI
jgi:hypothetical protein